MKEFYIASPEDIKEGRTTDVYFQRTKKILEAKEKDDVHVVMEVTIGSPPDNHPWGVLCGVEEVARLLEGTYHDFCEYETPILGLICQESAVASRAAYVRVAAGEKPVIAFGIRRIHPALAPAMDRAGYIGGLDGVSSVIGAETCGLTATGTMPHALIIVIGDQVEAWKAYDEVVEPESPRIILVDTYYDEKTEAIMAAEALGERLYGVRLDTPSSRRGSFPKIVKEVRWELNLRGRKDVKIFVSGGLNEDTVKELAEAGADAFGVGTWVSGAPTLDFAMDIVEVDGVPHAKRGKLGGKKQVWRCKECLSDMVTPAYAAQPRCGECGEDMEPMLKPLIKDGRIVAPLKTPREIREHVLSQLRRLAGETGKDS
jgi:nicotinate phosphoribosyltransferase